jgi:hypothetical protein
MLYRLPFFYNPLVSRVRAYPDNSGISGDRGNRRRFFSINNIADYSKYKSFFYHPGYEIREPPMACAADFN